MAFIDTILKYYFEKPECVIDFPEHLLPSERINEIKNCSGAAIIEIAGRDSIAAAIMAVKQRDISDLIPTYAYTGTEHGQWGTVGNAINHLRQSLDGVRIHEPILLGSPGFWQALNGRFITELFSRYGFYTPCVGCHLYLHSVRVPLAISLGKIPIISGEREMHDNRLKVNQTRKVINVYAEVVRKFGIELALPVREINEGAKITDILGFDWSEGEDQLECVLSGNYRMLKNEDKISETQAIRYLEEFAVPLSEEIITSYIEGKVPDHINIAKEILS